LMRSGCYVGNGYVGIEHNVFIGISGNKGQFLWRPQEADQLVVDVDHHQIFEIAATENGIENDDERHHVAPQISDLGERAGTNKVEQQSLEVPFDIHAFAGEEDERRLGHTGIASIVNQLEEPLNLAGPPIGLPMAAGRALHHLVDNMGFFDMRVILEPSNRVHVLNANDLFAGNRVALFIENNVKDYCLAALEYTLGQIDAASVILRIGITEDGDVAHG